MISRHYGFAESSLLDRSLGCFLTWTSILTGICLPLYFLWGLSGQRIYLTWSGIGYSYLLGYAGCLLLAGAIVSITTLIDWTLTRLNGTMSSFLWNRMHHAAAWAVAAYACAEATNRWVSSFPALRWLSVSHSNAIAAIAVAGIILWRDARCVKAPHSLRKESLGFIAVCGATACGLALAGALFGRIDHPSEVSPAIHQSEDSPNPQPQPNIVLVTVDTLSAMHSSLYGYPRDTMPGLEALARKATVYSNFYANGNFTTSAIASIHTGMRPWSHHAYSLQGWIPQSLGRQTIASRLQRSGYQAVCFVSNFIADPRHWGGDFGFHARISLHGGSSLERLLSPMLAWKEADWFRLRQQFPFSIIDWFDQRLAKENTTGLRWAFPSEQVYKRVLTYLQERRIGSETAPLFLWVHTFPPHDPYVPQSAFQKRYNGGDAFLSAAEQNQIPWGWYDPVKQGDVDILRDRYDEQVRYADDRLAQFLADLETQLPPQETLLVVTSDHGESFEKDFIRHSGPLLHEALIKVPLLIRYPGQSAGNVVDTPAEQVDLLPTILAEAGVEIPAELEGRSLARRTTQPDTPADNIVWSMSIDSNPSIDRLSRYTVAGIRGSLKYNAAMEQGWFVWEKLFDLASDPDELRDLSASRLIEVADFRQAFLLQLAEAESYRLRTGFP